MVNAYLFGGPADGTVVELTDPATTLDITMDVNPYIVHRYVVYSMNDLGETESQIYQYEGVTDD